MAKFSTQIIKGMALATGLALMSFSTSASATTLVNLTSGTMDSTYRAYIDGSETYSNGINFGVHEVVSGADYNLFAFCVDIFHHIGLGTYAPALNYVSNRGDPGEPLTTNSGTPVPTLLTTAQKNRVSALVDIGFIMNRDAPGAATSLQTAAIQAAIWQVLNPTHAITLRTDNLSGASATAYSTAYTNYLTGPVAAGDRIFTLVPSDGRTQSFAVGWPIDVPEPATWAMMMIGFFSLGSVLRARQRSLNAG